MVTTRECGCVTLDAAGRRPPIRIAGAERDRRAGRSGRVARRDRVAQKVGMEVDETRIPIRDSVRGACEILGLDPMFVANEGKLIAFVPQNGTESVLSAMRRHPLGKGATQIGTVVEDRRGLVRMHTSIGGERIVDLPFGESLPRIC